MWLVAGLQLGVCQGLRSSRAVAGPHAKRSNDPADYESQKRVWTAVKRREARAATEQRAEEEETEGDACSTLAHS